MHSFVSSTLILASDCRPFALALGSSHLKCNIRNADPTINSFPTSNTQFIFFFGLPPHFFSILCALIAIHCPYIERVCHSCLKFVLINITPFVTNEQAHFTCIVKTVGGGGGGGERKSTMEYLCKFEDIIQNSLDYRISPLLIPMLAHSRQRNIHTSFQISRIQLESAIVECATLISSMHPCTPAESLVWNIFSRFSIFYFRSYSFLFVKL